MNSVGLLQLASLSCLVLSVSVAVFVQDEWFLARNERTTLETLAIALNTATVMLALLSMIAIVRK
jgi:hypothetical protein